MTHPQEPEFEAFFRRVEPSLRRAHFASFGLDRGREATAEALAWAWEHWDRIKDVQNPAGYLFRVGQSRTRHRKEPPVFVRQEWREPWIEPRLGLALTELSEQQRLTVVLIHAFGWTMREVAELTGTRVPTVQTHLNRGLAKLRSCLEVDQNA
jgi:DNA-directed RNA polymerase specialized sigma24 family protein